MILTELFDTVAPYQFTPGGNTAGFNIADKRYLVDFSPTSEDDCTEVSFTMTTGVGSTRQANFAYGIEGSGDEILVFSTVVAIIKKYMDRTSLRKLIFTSKVREPSRIKLYDRMVSSIAHGWHVHTQSHGNEKEYVLTNPNFHTQQLPTGAPHEDVPF